MREIKLHLYNVLSYLCTITGNLFFRLNGNLDGLERKNLRNRIMYWMWIKAYFLGDEQCWNKKWKPKVGP